jgi:hypothetical protein
MNRQLLKAAFVFFAVYIFCHVLFGPAWAKKGIFFNGIKSVEEFKKIQQDHLARSKTVPIRQFVSVELTADGSAKYTCESVFGIVQGASEAKFYWAKEPDENTTIVNRDGQPMTFTFTKAKHSYIVWVDLEEPFADGEFVVKTNGPAPGATKKEDSLWHYKMHHTFGLTIMYEQVVTLPPGAVAIKVLPEPDSIYEKKGVCNLVFKTKLESTEFFECTIIYQLI